MIYKSPILSIFRSVALLVLLGSAVNNVSVSSAADSCATIFQSTNDLKFKISNSTNDSVGSKKALADFMLKENSRWLGIRRFLWKGPNEIWNVESYYSEKDGKLYISLSKTDPVQIYEVEGFSRRGNPILKIEAHSLVFKSRQTAVIGRASDFDIAASEKPAESTIKKAIPGTYYNSAESGFSVPEFQLANSNSAHLRLLSFWEASQRGQAEISENADALGPNKLPFPIYVEVLGVSLVHFNSTADWSGMSKIFIQKATE